MLIYNICYFHLGLIPRTSSHNFIKVNKSTFSGMLASYDYVKWYSELASVFNAIYNFIKYSVNNLPSLH